MAKVLATCLLLAAAMVVAQSACTDGDCDNEADSEALLQTKLVQEKFDISSEEPTETGEEVFDIASEEPEETGEEIEEEETDTLHPLGSFLDYGNEAVCGTGEEVVSTNCLGDSLVKSQGGATARMMMGGCCTAWLVKAKTSSQGALMLTTGHCGKSASADFNFDYVAACPGGAGKSTTKTCRGNKVSAETVKDEQAIYELGSCGAADAATPILLDIGNPDEGEGIYILGHPNCRPQLLSHQEVHDDGHHCEVRKPFTMGGSKRISYYCDTQGGNSGSPVFSARTGYAFAIHSHGGCNGNQMSRNSGGLLGDNPGVIAAFNKFSIPYVNRNTASLFQYEDFVEETQCFDHAQSMNLVKKTLKECKTLCVNSLTCVGVEHSQAKQTCEVNYRSSATPGTCQGDAKHYKRKKTLTKSLVHQAPPTTTPKPTQPPSKAGACNFESASTGNLYCNMWNPKASGDQFDWSRGSRTSSYNTGPDTPGNNFLFIETSSPRRSGDKAILESVPVTLGSSSSLSFNYHMKGSNIGELKVVLKLPHTEVPLWSKKGQQGSNWQAANVPLPSQVAGQLAYIRFVGVRGSSWAGDIAIDEVALDLGGSAPPTTVAPTSPPTQAPTTIAPTSPPTNPPTSAPTNPPSTAGPTSPPTNPPGGGSKAACNSCKRALPRETKRKIHRLCKKLNPGCPDYCKARRQCKREAQNEECPDVCPAPRGDSTGELTDEAEDAEDDEDEKADEEEARSR